MSAPLGIRLAVALLLAACTASPVARGDDMLDGLPLSADARNELSALQSNYEGPEARAQCTPDEIEFFMIGMTLFAVHVEREMPDMRPWTAAQKARVDTLTRRWEELGGDARTVSKRCVAIAKRLQPASPSDS